MAKSKKKKLKIVSKSGLSRTHMLITVLSVAIVGIVLTIAVFAAGRDKATLSFVPGMQDGGRHNAQPVDWLTWCGDCVSTDWTTQTPWVNNPTKCMWDTDDWFVYRSNGGALAPGATASISDCSYEYTSANNPNASKLSVIHAANIKIASASPNLKITETYTWAGGTHSFSPTAVWDSAARLYRYNSCILINGVSNGTWVQVPGSDGGYGVPVQIVATVNNPTSRSIKDVSGYIQYGWQQYYAAGCNVNLSTTAPL